MALKSSLQQVLVRVQKSICNYSKIRVFQCKVTLHLIDLLPLPKYRFVHTKNVFLK